MLNTGPDQPPVFLIGGGWSPDAVGQMYGPFLEAAGASPTVACVVLDEGDGTEQFRRWEAALRAAGRCEPVPVLVPEGGLLEVGALSDADALLVCGGLTPAYAAALAPVAGPVREWLGAASRPYAGFSAGCAVAATRAVVGGWRLDGRVVCPEDAGEDLDEVTVLEGLGLVPFSTDVHAAQWGTLGRLVAAVASGAAAAGLGIDEDTMVSWLDGTARVSGAGAATLVTSSGGGVVAVRALTAGAALPGTDF
jgi:cyanophycinase